MKRRFLSATQIHQREQARVGPGRECGLRGPAHGKRRRHDKGLVIALGRLQANRPERPRLGWRWCHGDFDCLFFRVHDVGNMAVRRRHRNPENWNLKIGTRDSFGVWEANEVSKAFSIVTSRARRFGDRLSWSGLHPPTAACKFVSIRGAWSLPDYLAGGFGMVAGWTFKPQAVASCRWRKSNV